MSELKTNLDEILLEKQTKIIPENIKAGVTILGVEGTLDSVELTDYFNTTPQDGQSLTKAYPDTIDCSNLTYFSFGNDFSNTYISNLINTENVRTINGIASTNTLGFTQTELDVSSMALFSWAFNSFSNITSIPKLKNLFKNFIPGFMLDFSYFCAGCANLETIPEFEIACEPSALNGSSVPVSNMIQNCPKLTEQSITNILNFLKLLNDNGVSFDVHTLADVGFSYDQLTALTSAQLEIVSSMSGWTTGLELYTTEIEIGDLYADIGSKQILLENTTLQNYLDIVATKVSINEWIASVTADSFTEEYKNTSSTELINKLNNLKFRANSDSIAIQIQLSVNTTDGTIYTFINPNETYVSANTKTAIDLNMMYIPVTIDIDTKGKDLSGFTMSLFQYNSSLTEMTSLSDFVMGGTIPIGVSTILTHLGDYSNYYYFQMTLSTAYGITMNSLYICDDFTEQNLTLSFTVNGVMLEDKSVENNVMSNVMILCGDADDGHIDLYYKPTDTLIQPDTNSLNLYRTNELVVGAYYNLMDQNIEEGYILCQIGDDKPLSDINAYSYGPAEENDVSL